MSRSLAHHLIHRCTSFMHRWAPALEHRNGTAPPGIKNELPMNLPRTPQFLTDPEIKRLHRFVGEADALRVHQLVSMVQAGESPAQAVGAVRFADDRITTVFVLGLYALLVLRGGWEATRDLALALDVHPLGFATGWVPDRQETEMIDLLGIRDRFVAFRAGEGAGTYSDPSTSLQIARVRLGSSLRSGDLEEGSIRVEARAPGLGTSSTHSAGRGSQSEASCPVPGLGDLRRMALIVLEPQDLCLGGNPARLETLFVRGRLGELGSPK